MTKEDKDVQLTEETLCDVCNGTYVQIKGLNGEANVCHRLREMGFCERACIQKVADNGALICQVKDSNVIISKQLAKNVIVENIQ